MSTTLTNGLKLPDKGSVDWYADMQNNYSILDGAVGTVAEHTTALSGKAPLVHTHSKADITDFPAYGTTAGTICEGNDSRLSDARTPVAHTHVTADVTDLLNGNHTWTGDNTFSKAVGFTKVNATTLYAQNSRAELGESGLSGDSYNQIAFWDKNGDNFSYLRQTYGSDGNNGLHIFVRNKFLNNAPDTTGTVDYAYFGLKLGADKFKEAIFKASLRPYDTTYNYNLGDSTYQWNNLYAKNYYYNGTAWGLDKYNTWSQNNRYTGFIELQYTQSSGYSDIRWFDETGAITCCCRHSESFLTLGKRYTGKTAWYDGSQFLLTSRGLAVLKGYDGTNQSSVALSGSALYPETSNVDLGDSTNKWKTLNGVNPGALSLPDNSGYTNISGNITDLTGAINNYTPPSDGYVMVNVNPNSNNYAYVSLERVTVRSSSETTSGKNAMTTIPVIGGKSIDISVIGASIAQARFTPCLGNV